MHVAAGEGKTQAVLALIKEHQLDPNATDSVGKTPLHYAADERGAEKHDTRETIDALLKNGARIDARDQNGNTILHFAARADKPTLIAELMRAHAMNPNVLDNERYSPLALAINNMYCLVEFVLRCGGAQLTNGERRFDSFTGSCLNRLRTKSDRETVLTALEQESLAPWDPNMIDNGDNLTPLIHAAKQGCTSCITMLLKDPRTNINSQDSERKTALHYIIENWRTAYNAGSKAKVCARLLNLKRTNVGLKNNDGQTPRQHLDMLIQAGYKDDVIRDFEKLFDLRKMRVQLYLSLKNACCSEQCDQIPCLHSAHLPADIRLKIAGLLTEESLPKRTHL